MNLRQTSAPHKYQNIPISDIYICRLVIQLMDKPNTEQEIKVEQPPTDTHIIVESAHIQDDYHDGYQKF